MVVITPTKRKKKKIFQTLIKQIPKSCCELALLLFLLCLWEQVMSPSCLAGAASPAWQPELWPLRGALPGRDIWLLLWSAVLWFPLWCGKAHGPQYICIINVRGKYGQQQKKEKNKRARKEQKLFRVSWRADKIRMECRVTGWVCLHALGYLGEEENSDLTLCHWTSSPFLETSVPPVSHILQALQGRDTAVFTDKVSTGPNRM